MILTYFKDNFEVKEGIIWHSQIEKQNWNKISETKIAKWCGFVVEHIIKTVDINNQ